MAAMQGQWLVFLAWSAALAQTAPPAPAAKAAAPLPVIERHGAAAQMMVDGKPFLMLAGELHNSSASSIDYMKPIWPKLEAMHLNTVIGTASWELVEPEENQFDFTLVDDQIRQARAHHMRLVLIWFGTWKNANASYTPLWVKGDLRRFPRVESRDGAAREELSPLGEQSVAADAKAFRALMRHIREVDPEHTVIMMQVENETGKIGDSRDRSPLAEAAWNQPVPSALMKYLSENKSHLLPELTNVWAAGGFKTSGTWPKVFGTDAYADEVFMAWYIARYVGKVAEAGKAELPIPMYANAWLVQDDDQLPGGYPSGGPVSRVHDIWRAAAPQLDLLAPDIYLDDFRGICAGYTRSGNPLFIPEARASVPNLFWAIGRHAALGYSPFGIESLPEDTPLAAAYQTLEGLMPLLAKYQPEGQVVPVVQEWAEQKSQTIALGGYRLKFTFGAASRVTAPSSTRPAPPELAYALVIHTAPDEFVLVGQGVSMTPAPDSPGPRLAGFGTIDEGRYEKGVWIPGRRINGDESNGGVRAILRGPGPGTLRIKLYRYE
jgi:hypothetical protein